MSERTSYDILGISATDSDDAIRSAYRKLAVQLHPDKNPGDAGSADRFREVTAAYEMVKDSDRRGRVAHGYSGIVFRSPRHIRSLRGPQVLHVNPAGRYRPARYP